MLGGYLEFFMSSATAEMFQTLRRELDELIQTKVSEKGRAATSVLVFLFLFCILFPLHYL